MSMLDSGNGKSLHNADEEAAADSDTFDLMTELTGNIAGAIWEKPGNKIGIISKASFCS